MDARYQSVAELFKSLSEAHAAGKGQTELAVLLGTAQPVVSRIMRGESLPPENVVKRIREIWGADISVEVRAAREGMSRVKNRGPKPSQQKQDTGVPYYDVDFVGGFDFMINDQTVTPSGYLNVDKFSRATCLCNITGHSMEPEINHGDIIVLRKIDDWSFLPLGEIYAIVTRNDMRTVKRLGRGSTEETFLLIPTNKSGGFEPQEIKKSDITIIYEVMGCVKKF